MIEQCHAVSGHGSPAPLRHVNLSGWPEPTCRSRSLVLATPVVIAACSFSKSAQPISSFALWTYPNSLAINTLSLLQCACRVVLLCLSVLPVITPHAQAVVVLLFVLPRGFCLQSRALQPRCCDSCHCACSSEELDASLRCSVWRWMLLSDVQRQSCSFDVSMSCSRAS